MSSEDVNRIEAMIREMTKSNGLRGWKAAGVVAAVLTAVATPVLGVSWYASNRMAQLDSVQRDLEQTRIDLASFRSEVGADISGLRVEVQRLREAFAAYARTTLPLIVQDPLGQTPPGSMYTPNPVPSRSSVP